MYVLIPGENVVYFNLSACINNTAFDVNFYGGEYSGTGLYLGNSPNKTNSAIVLVTTTTVYEILLVDY